jgi:hypothetical protein
MIDEVDVGIATVNSVVPAGNPAPLAANENDPPEAAVVAAKLVGMS